MICKFGDSASTPPRSGILCTAHHSIVQISIFFNGARRQDGKVFILYANGREAGCQPLALPADLRTAGEGFSLFQVSFSIRDAGKSILRRTGPYRGYLPYHLAHDFNTIK